MTIIYHNDPSLAARITKQMLDHHAADQVFGGEYWNGEGGCFIGCIAHSNDVSRVEQLTGLDEMTTRIAESIFEGLPSTDRPQFFKDMALCMERNIGKDITLVPWLFLYDTVKRAMSHADPATAKACAPALEVARLKSIGENVTADAAYAARADADAAYVDAAAYAARADADAARAAYAARAAARAAAYAAAYAARAAARADAYAAYAARAARAAADAADAYTVHAAAYAAAERRQQAETLIKLIDGAPTT